VVQRQCEREAASLPLTAIDDVHCLLVALCTTSVLRDEKVEQEGQHPVTGQRAANFRLLTNQ